MVLVKPFQALNDNFRPSSHLATGKTKSRRSYKEQSLHLLFPPLEILFFTLSFYYSKSGSAVPAAGRTNASALETSFLTKAKACSMEVV